MNDYNHPGNRWPTSDKSDLQIQFEAVGKALMICIQASRCPTCNAPPYKICLTESNKKRSHHVKRIHEGHLLIAKPVSSFVDEMIKKGL